MEDRIFWERRLEGVSRDRMKKKKKRIKGGAIGLAATRQREKK